MQAEANTSTLTFAVNALLVLNQAMIHLHLQIPFEPTKKHNVLITPLISSINK